MQPPRRITVRSAAQPRGWLLPLPPSYDALRDAAHDCLVASEQPASDKSTLQLFVNRGRVTADTFYLLRDRDVLDALYIAAPPAPASSFPDQSSAAAAPTAPSPPDSTTLPVDSAATLSLTVTPAAAWSRKRPAPPEDDEKAHSDDQLRASLHSQLRSIMQPSPPPASPPPPYAESEMPPLSPDPAPVFGSAPAPAQTAATAAAAASDGGRVRRASRSDEIVLDDGAEEEQKANGAVPSPVRDHGYITPATKVAKREPASASIAHTAVTAPPAQPVPQPVGSSTSAAPLERRVSVTPVIRSQWMIQPCHPPPSAIRHPPHSFSRLSCSRPYLCVPGVCAVHVVRVLGCSSPGCDKRAEYGVRARREPPLHKVRTAHTAGRAAATHPCALPCICCVCCVQPCPDCHAKPSFFCTQQCFQTNWQAHCQQYHPASLVRGR